MTHHHDRDGIATHYAHLTSGASRCFLKSTDPMNAQNAAAVFQVSDLEQSLRHYTEVLGFSEDFRFGDYAGLKLGEVSLHLSGHSVHERPLGGGTVYIFCDEVDSHHADIKAKGATIKVEPRSYDYGMRDFVIVDPDGNHLTFGCAVGNGSSS